MDKTKLSQLNSYETDFVYSEIFEKNVYLRNGIRLKKNATVVDVGANIGLFSLFVKKKCPTAQVFAFEPAPDAYRCLVKNCARFKTSIQMFNVAISSRRGTSKFVYYPGYSVISGLYANRSVDSAVIETGMRGANTVVTDEEIQQTVSKRFKKRVRLEVKTQTVANFIRDSNLNDIHLLKIDAERAESSILAGIGAANWPKIHQIVLEVHSAKDSRAITKLLKSKGYKVTCGKYDSLSNCGIGTLFAVRIRK